ncbi:MULTISPECIES: hypothetical protein [Streptomyces]|nr:hypothetical protein [Streptomyces sp. NEAU-383]
MSEQRVVDGRTRRVYKATEAGKQALKELAREVLGDEAPQRPGRSTARGG